MGDPMPYSWEPEYHQTSFPQTETPASISPTSGEAPQSIDDYVDSAPKTSMGVPLRAPRNPSISPVNVIHSQLYQKIAEEEDKREANRLQRGLFAAVAGILLVYSGIVYTLNRDLEFRKAKMTASEWAEYQRKEKRGPLVLWDVFVECAKDYAK